ncbi:vomeronasal type-2 receptor 116-like [Tupaia chinensis]|uniref:vomeronasal type-2 receptor 116-like n=1 Tax=Tupaia chinensis TaxID=246437 RepID=UPI000703D400|nr:vomeronasal type-2 receptor 116-like [Tupaia chinensis]
MIKAQNQKMKQVEGWFWKNYQYVLAFLFVIEEINQSPHLLPNLSLGSDLYNAFPTQQRTLESAVVLLSGGSQPLPNYNCNRKKQPIAVFSGTTSAFAAELGSLLELYKIPQITYGPFDPILSNKNQFSSLYQIAPKDSFLTLGLIGLLHHFGWTWVALFVPDDTKGEQFLQDLKAQMLRQDICVAFTEKLPMTTGFGVYRDFKFVLRIRISSANVYVIYGDLGSLMILDQLKYVNSASGKLHSFLRKTAFTNSAGENMSFGDSEHYMTQYDIQNLVKFPNDSWMLVKVGEFVSKSPHDQDLVIEKEMLKWPDAFQETPSSVCTQSCAPGFRKIAQEERPICCFLCVSCPEREISNWTDAQQCFPCLPEQYPNSEKTHCLPKPVTFLGFEDSLGMALACIALCFSVVTAVVLGLFVKHRDTPIIKANNRALSFTLLISLLLCFLCSLLFIGHPNTATCILRQVTFGLVFTVAVSTILAKTMTVILAFKAMTPGRTLRRLLLSGASNSVIPICSLIQVIICAIWLGSSPPFVDTDSHSEPRSLIIVCNKGSVTAFHCVLGYLGSLALGSFTVAFLARNLPETFNEARFLTFSMLLFCSVWVTFLPVYHSTKGKVMVAVEVFSILVSSAGLLGCIFAPKCYTILIKPDKNSIKGLKTRNISRRNEP